MANKARWNVTPAHHDFIVKHQAHISRAALTVKFNKKFGLNTTVDSMRSYTKRNGLNIVIKTMVSNAEQRAWIVENQAGLERRTLTQCFNNRFGKSLKVPQLTAYCCRNGLKADRIIRNCKPVGTISRQGKWLCIKTANPNKWEPLHRVQWEAYNRKKIPSGFMILFADGDCDNLSANNLVCVHESASITINHSNKADTNNPDLNKAIMLTASLNALVSERSRRLKNNVRNNNNG